MKKIFSKFNVLLMAVFIAVMFTAFMVYANQTFVAPSGVQYAWDRDGNGYTISSGTVSVPETYANDFTKAGYKPLPTVFTTATVSTSTSWMNAKIYAGSLTMVGTGANAASNTITGTTFTANAEICTATDITAAHAVTVTINSLNNITFAIGANAADTVNYICIGQ